MSDRFPRARLHVVTGGRSGIGRALVERLTARGDEVVLLVREEGQVEELARDFPTYSSIHPVDLADAEAVAAFAEEFGRGRPGIRGIDSLVHAAGEVELGPVAGLDRAAWQRQLAVNLTAPAVLTAGLLPLLRAVRGTVVLLNSTAGLQARAEWSGYAASKSGLRAFADSLRAEEAEHGVRVSTVYPGRTATAMQERVHRQEGREYDAARWVRPETVAEAIERLIDLPPDATMTDLTLRPA